MALMLIHECPTVPLTFPFRTENYVGNRQSHKCRIVIIGASRNLIDFLHYVACIWCTTFTKRVTSLSMGHLPDTQNCGLRMHRECRKRFPRRRLRRKPPVSDPGMHHGTWKRSWHSRHMHTRNFTYLARGPLWHTLSRSSEEINLTTCKSSWCCWPDWFSIQVLSTWEHWSYNT